MYRRYPRRRYAPRRRRYAARRTRRYARRSRVSRYSGTRNVFKIRRSIGGPSTTIQGNDAYAPYIPSTTIAGLNVYQLDDLTNYTEFTNLFEEYRIVGVKHRFHLRRMPNSGAPLAASSTVPTLYWSTTRSGYSADLLPSNLNNMLEQANMKQRTLVPGKPVTFYHRVYNNNQQTGSTLLSSYAVSQGWTPCADAGIAAYYGLMFLIDELRDPAQFVDITSTYYVQFRGIR